jgi:hypothetical protein
MATTDAAYDLLEAHVAAHQPDHAPVSLVHSHSYDNTLGKTRGSESSSPEGSIDPHARGHR